MAEIVLSILAKVSEYLVDPAIRGGHYLFCVRKIIKNLEKEKVKLTLTRDGVYQRVEEARKKTEKIGNAVEKWLHEVQKLLAEVENLELEMKANIYLLGLCPSCRRYHLCKQLAKKTKIMTELNNNSKFERFSRLATLPSIEYFSTGNFTYFESTKLAYNQLLEGMRDDGCYMIGLYGMGGCGKTTLVTEVGKKALELKLFDRVILVTVSQTPNIESIQEKMADMLGFKLEEKN